MSAGALLGRLEQRFRVLTFAKAMVPTMAALGIQFLAFVVTARGLGAEQFGVYSGILALAVVGGDIVGIGAIDLLSRATARDRSAFPRYFGHFRRMTLLTLPVVWMVGMFVALYVMRMQAPVWLLGAALCAETLIGRSLSALESTMVAHGDTVAAAWTRFSAAAFRLVAAVACFLVLGRTDIASWAVTIVFLALANVAFNYVLGVSRYGRPQGWWARGETGAGAVFCVTQIATSVQNNVDRVVLTRLASAADVGAYGAAVRVLQLGFFPLQVATRITFPKFFTPQHAGPRKGLKFARKVALAMSLVGVLACVLVVIASLAVPRLLGADYAASQRILVLLSLALPIIAVQTPPADVLIACSLQSLRAAIYWGGAIGFLVLAVIGASLGGATGIALAFVAAQLLLAVALWTALWLAARGEPQAGQPVSA